MTSARTIQTGVLPAQAGVILCYTNDTNVLEGTPRASGGDPSCEEHTPK